MHLAIIGIILVGLTLGPLLAAISEFGPHLAAKQRHPVYEEWRLVEITKYITHLDFISFFQWMTGAVIRIAMSLYLCVDVLNIKSKQVQNGTLWVISCSVLVLGLIPISDTEFYEMLKYHYFPLFVPTVILISIVLLIFCYTIKY